MTWLAAILAGLCFARVIWLALEISIERDERRRLNRREHIAGR
jgi:hypothetical protein